MIAVGLWLEGVEVGLEGSSRVGVGLEDGRGKVRRE